MKGYYFSDPDPCIGTFNLFFTPCLLDSITPGGNPAAQVISSHRITGCDLAKSHPAPSAQSWPAYKINFSCFYIQLLNQRILKQKTVSLVD